jgi:hypothetical protein
MTAKPARPRAFNVRSRLAGSLLAAAVAAAVPLVNGGRLSAQAQAPRLELRAGDRIVLVGNTLAERMQLFNHFETLLMAQFPERRLVIRNMGWSADTITLQPRPLNFGAAPTHLYRQKADVILIFFGSNESFAGEAGVAQFELDLDAYLRGHQSAQYNGASPPRLVLVSPIAHEKLSRLPDVDAEARNVELSRYTEGMRRVASARSVVFVDLFTPTRRLMAAGAVPMTINGIHLNEHGDRIAAGLLIQALGFGEAARAATGADLPRLEALRETIRDKNQQFFYRFRPVNAEYVVGRRVEPFGSVNFPGEMKQLDQMVAERDRRIWDQAARVRGLRYPDDVAAGATAKVAR